MPVLFFWLRASAFESGPRCLRPEARGARPLVSSTPPMSEIVSTPAKAEDLFPIKDLLFASGLPTAGVDEHWKTFIVARDGDKIVACGGAEAYQFAALIRSVAVAHDYRSR